LQRALFRFRVKIVKKGAGTSYEGESFFKAGNQVKNAQRALFWIIDVFALSVSMPTTDTSIPESIKSTHRRIYEKPTD
jgi:hypothetical protein